MKVATEDEALQKAAQYAIEAHIVDEVTPEMVHKGCQVVRKE